MSKKEVKLKLKKTEDGRPKFEGRRREQEESSKGDRLTDEFGK